MEELVDFEEPAEIARIRTEAEAFAADHVTPAVVEEELRSGDGVNRELMEAMGRRRWIALTWPLEEGGAGLDPFEAAAVLGAIRAAGGPTIGAGTTMLAANAVRALASEDLKARILPGVAAGKTLICLGFTEPEGGSDVFACKTRSVRDGDEWVINGQKMFTTYRAPSRLLLLVDAERAPIDRPKRPDHVPRPYGHAGHRDPARAHHGL